MRWLQRWRAAGPVRHLAGSVGSLGVAVLLYSRYGMDGYLSRDEAIYLYAGQQLSHGVLPYESIFDPKGPGAGVIAGAAAGLAHAVGRSDVYAVRMAFFVCACLTVLCVYLLAVRLWNSVTAGLITAVAFASFRAFAMSAPAGPDAKTPCVMFAMLSTYLLLRRKWSWAGVAGALAALTWQPAAIYLVVVGVAACVQSSRSERRSALTKSLLGGGVPFVTVATVYWAAGALDVLVESTVAYPLTGVSRYGATLSSRVDRIIWALDHYYFPSGAALFWSGSVLIVLSTVWSAWQSAGTPRERVTHPALICVLLPFLGQVGYALTDFQSYPDLYPLLPYPALGVAGAVVIALGHVRQQAARGIAVGGVALAVVLAVSGSWHLFSDDAVDDGRLHEQLANACAVKRVLGARGRLYVMGDPTPLALTHRQNPDRFIYLGSGIDRWKVRHQAGGFPAWTSQVEAAHPRIILISSWNGSYREPMVAWIRSQGYRRAHAGPWKLMMRPPARKYARRIGIDLPIRRSDTVTRSIGGRELPPWPCRG